MNNMNNMNNIDVNKLMDMLSKMDKKDLEKGMVQAAHLLYKGNPKEILKNIKK